MAIFSHASCVQMPVVPGDIEANCTQLRQQLAATRLPEGTLVVLPELWATGFDYPNIIELSRHTKGILKDLQQLAAEQNLWFAGTLPEYSKGGQPYNTMYLVGADGVAGQYRKHHLFSFWQEDRYFQAGDHPRPINIEGELLGALVCYDLRFPEISRNHIFEGCKLIMLSAQWPAARLDHWQVLVRARAIESQAFIVACNSCGTSGLLDLAGRSLIVDPTGRLLAQAGEQSEIIVGELDWEELTAVRSRFCPSGERPWAREDTNKVTDLSFVQQKLAMYKKQGSKIVFTNGCFDILHAGHVSYLEQARKCGDCLVIGLNSDSSVRALKGENRPVNSEQERARVLAALGCVDYVLIFDDDTPQKLISTLLPDILVKGADWPEDQIVGAAEVKAAGGKVERIVFEHQVSTTQVIDKIRQKPN